MCDGESLHMAVKALQESSSEEERVSAGGSTHEPVLPPDIMSIYGVVTTTAPVSHYTTSI